MKRALTRLSTGQSREAPRPMPAVPESQDPKSPPSDEALRAHIRAVLRQRAERRKRTTQP
jgi:hypothetical protein